MLAVFAGSCEPILYGLLEERAVFWAPCNRILLISGLMIHRDDALLDIGLFIASTTCNKQMYMMYMHVHR